MPAARADMPLTFARLVAAMTLSLVLSQLVVMALTGRGHVLRRSWRHFVTWLNYTAPAPTAHPAHPVARCGAVAGRYADAAARDVRRAMRRSRAAALARRAAEVSRRRAARARYARMTSGHAPSRAPAAPPGPLAPRPAAASDFMAVSAPVR